MRYIRKVISFFQTLFLFALLICVLAGFLPQYIPHVSIGIADTAIDHIRNGSITYIYETSPGEMDEGDVIACRTESGSALYRIISVRKDETVVSDDATMDPEAIIKNGDVLGKVVFHVPYMGTFCVWMKNHYVLLFAIAFGFVVWDCFVSVWERWRTQRILKAYGAKERKKARNSGNSE